MHVHNEAITFAVVARTLGVSSFSKAVADAITPEVVPHHGLAVPARNKPSATARCFASWLESSESKSTRAYER